jgi:hypothetical protein
VVSFRKVRLVLIPIICVPDLYFTIYMLLHTMKLKYEVVFIG